MGGFFRKDILKCKSKGAKALDQIKIGNFIQELRKEKGLTQRKLADCLNISDKTVSKWETGKGLPDVSLMLPLCKVLDISVNELLSAKKLEPPEYHQKAEENIMDLMKEKQESKKKIALSILITFICVLSSLTIILLASYIVLPTWQKVLLYTIAFIDLLGGLFASITLDLNAGTFECPHCKARFIPATGAYINGMHTLTLRRLTCPVCGKRSFCRRRLTH